MSKVILILYLAVIAYSGIAQVPGEYSVLIRRADSSYNKGNYKASAALYSAAFRSTGWKPDRQDRYNAACSWSLSGNADSAFHHLEWLASNNMTAYQRITTDPDLNSLHSNKRWLPFLEKVKQNKEKAEVNLNKPLARLLDSIYVEDQKYRMMIGDIEKKHGFKSKEMQEMWKVIMKKDSSNLVVVTDILDKHGWLGPDIIGEQGASTLFLVVQHANTKTQVKYLPMMREAVKNGKARSENLALLEDRVALAQGRKQIYGSQIQQDPNTGKYFVAPIEDEPNVNKRRASVGLGPREDYVRQWNIDYTLPAK